VTVAADEDKANIHLCCTVGSGTYYVTGVMVEKSSVLTPYFDGTYPDCAWTGAANASTSTRAASVLTMPAQLIGSRTLGVGFRFSPLWAANDNLAHPLFSFLAGETVVARIYKHTDNTICVTATDGSVSTTIASAAQSFAAGSLNTLVASIGDNTLALTLNGTVVTLVQGSRQSMQVDAIRIDADSTYLGPLVVSTGTLTSAVINNLLSQSALSVFQRQVWASDRTALVLPLEQDSVGYQKEPWFFGPVLAVTSPAGGESWVHDSTHDVTFTSTPAMSTGNFRLQVYDALGVGLSQWISSLIPAVADQTDYTCSWTVTQSARTTWRVRVYYYDGGGVIASVAHSAANFTVSA
jgi:hypothetical protein